MEAGRRRAGLMARGQVAHRVPGSHALPDRDGRGDRLERRAGPPVVDDEHRAPGQYLGVGHDALERCEDDVAGLTGQVDPAMARIPRLAGRIEPSYHAARERPP